MSRAQLLDYREPLSCGSHLHPRTMKSLILILHQRAYVGDGFPHDLHRWFLPAAIAVGSCQQTTPLDRATTRPSAQHPALSVQEVRSLAAVAGDPHGLVEWMTRVGVVSPRCLASSDP